MSTFNYYVIGEYCNDYNHNYCIVIAQCGSIEIAEQIKQDEIDGKYFVPTGTYLISKESVSHMIENVDIWNQISILTEKQHA